MVKNSESCGKSEVDLFSIPPTQIYLEDSIFDKIGPKQALENGVNNLEFNIKGNSAQYLALSDTELYLKVKIINK